MAEAVDIKKEIIDDMLETLKEQVSRYKNLVNSDDVTLDQLKDFDNQISEIYDTLQKVSNTQLTLLVSEIEDYKTQFETKLSEFENILNNIDVSNITLNLTPEQIESLKGDKGEDGQSFTFDMFTTEQLESLKGEKGDKGEDGQSFTFDMFTPEQLQSLKGEKGDKGDIGLTGEKGDTGSAFTYDMFTPEQLQSLKGEKGDSGQDGLITVDSMTELQKQELANLIAVPSRFLSIVLEAQQLIYMHYKTNINIDNIDNFYFEYKYFIPQSGGNSHSYCHMTSTKIIAPATIKSTTSENLTFYKSSDGYLCFYRNYATKKINLDFILGYNCENFAIIESVNSSNATNVF